jgi:hypothetical protein
VLHGVLLLQTRLLVLLACRDAASCSATCSRRHYQSQSLGNMQCEEEHRIARGSMRFVWVMPVQLIYDVIPGI